MRLTSLLRQARRAPPAPAGQSSRDELIESLGGGREGRTALARRLAGLKREGALPRKGTKARHRYDAAMRALQRQAGGINPRTGQPRQTRAGNKAINRRIERLASNERRRREREQRSKKGVRVNVRAIVRISADRRPRDFDLFISASDWNAIMDLMDSGEYDDAAGSLEELILFSRDMDDLGAEIEDVTGQITSY